MSGRRGQGRGHRRGRNRTGRTPSFKDARPAPHARHVGRCEFTGKYRYPYKRDAKAVKAASGMSNHLHVYECEFCGHFELGSKGGLPRAVHREFHAAKGTPTAQPTPAYGTPPTTPYDADNTGDLTPGDA